MEGMHCHITEYNRTVPVMSIFLRNLQARLNYGISKARTLSQENFGSFMRVSTLSKKGKEKSLKNAITDKKVSRLKRMLDALFSIGLQLKIENIVVEKF